MIAVKRKPDRIRYVHIQPGGGFFERCGNLSGRQAYNQA